MLLTDRDIKEIRHWEKVIKKYLKLSDERCLTNHEWEQYHLACAYKKKAEETPIKSK